MTYVIGQVYLACPRKLLEPGNTRRFYGFVVPVRVLGLGQIKEPQAKVRVTNLKTIQNKAGIWREIREANLSTWDQGWVLLEEL